MFALAADSVRWEGGEGGGGAASGPAQPGLPFIFLSVSDFGPDLPSSIRAVGEPGEISARRCSIPELFHSDIQAPVFKIHEGP